MFSAVPRPVGCDAADQHGGGQNSIEPAFGQMRDSQVLSSGCPARPRGFQGLSPAGGGRPGQQYFVLSYPQRPWRAVCIALCNMRWHTVVD